MEIKFGKTPKVFKKIPVKFTMPGGEPGAIGVVFKYHTRTQYGEWLGRLHEIEDVEAPDADEKPDFAALFAAGGEKTVVRLLEAIDSWDFEYPLEKDTLVQLQNEYPAAIAAFGRVFRAACIEGALGN